MPTPPHLPLKVVSILPGSVEFELYYRKKSVVQRVCANKATFLGQDIPDNMNAFGVYDYSVWSKSFRSAAQYKEYLAKKSGIKMSKGIFSEERSDWQTTEGTFEGSAGLKMGGFGGDVSMSGSSVGGSSSKTSGVTSSRSLEKQARSKSSSESNSHLAVLEADFKLYEIALDHSVPSDLSAAFLGDFSNLPTSYYYIGADVKLQDFILRYGTQYIKSAKFGGKLDVFKR